MIFKMWKLWPKLVSHFKYHEIREFNTSIQNKLWLKTEMIFFRFHPLELNKLNIFYKPFLRIYGSGMHQFCTFAFLAHVRLSSNIVLLL